MTESRESDGRASDGLVLDGVIDPRLRVAAVQASPVFLDRDATVDKACDLIAEAAAEGAQLIVFGENFLPGHPVWFHTLPPTDVRSMELAERLVENAITIPGPETERLGAAAQAAGAMIVMGVVEQPEPGISVIHSSQLVVAADGTIAGLRRKIVPAVGERVFLTPGAGDSIRVFESPWGPISALAGGENSNPLLTYALRTMGARIHVAGWPPHFHKPGIMHGVMTITGRAVAYQNSAYVISVAGAADPSVAEQVAGTEAHRENLEAMTSDPGSVIYAPRGKLLAGPLHGEGILYADIDPTAGTWAQLVNRQYDRPDLLKLVVSTQPQGPGTEFVDGPLTGGPRHGDEATTAEAIRLIRERYGDRISAEDAEELLPYVAQVISRSEQLEALDLTTDDPRTTGYGRAVDAG
ncbi:MAG: nitrilase-related carbon-nitrogen hydrolase [Gemmatimonadota bacterium]|nr:nitrilase-related carbon-nitrogen hydrolase [Gemmatimonadota bacterium]